MNIQTFARSASDNARIIEVKAFEGLDSIVISMENFLFSAEYEREGHDLIITGSEGESVILEGYFLTSEPLDLVTPEGAVLRGEVISVLSGPENKGAYAQQGAAQGATPIGQVETLEGTAQVQRTDGTLEPLQIGTKVFQNDVVITQEGSTLSITFADKTVFTLAANSRMVLSELVYAPESANNSAVFNLIQGSFVFVAGQVAATGDMQVQTPVATMGIRGTTVTVNIVQDANGQSTVTVSLNRDIDGSIGSIELINNLDGTVTQITATDSSWVISPQLLATTEIPRTADDQASDLVIINEVFDAVRSLEAREAAGQQPVNLDDVDAGDAPGEPAPEDGENTDGDNADDQNGEPTGEGTGENTGDGSQDGNDADTDASEGELGDRSSLGSGLTTDGIGDNQSLDALVGSDTTTNIASLDSVDVEPFEFNGNDGGIAATDVPETEETQIDEIVGDQGPVQLSLNLPTFDITIPEDGSGILTGFNFSGPEQITATFEVGSTLRIVPGSGVEILPGSIESVPGSGDYDVLVLRGTASQINTALNGSTYTASPDDDDGGTLTVTLEGDGIEPVSGVINIAIEASNDAPTLQNATLEVSDDGSGASLDLSIIADDVDTGEDGSTLTYSTPNIATELPTGGVSISGSTLTFDPGDDFDFLGEGEETQRNVTLRATDSEGASTESEITLTIEGVNDAPENTVPGAQTAEEDTPLVISGVSFSDVDLGNGTLTVTLSVNNGILEVTTEPFRGRLPDSGILNNGTSSVTLVGTIEEINTTIGSTNGLVYRSDANFSGSDELSILANDGNDATLSTVDITVNAVNDTPVTNDATATGDEDAASIAITLSGSDIDGTVANFRILSLPNDGTLFTDAGLANAVSVNDLVAASNNEAGLFFVPNENFEGTPGFTFAAVDNEGLQDATPATATITVNAVNDAPETNDATATGSEDDASVSVTLSGSDVDGTVASFRILSLPSDGALFAPLTTNALSVGDIVTASNNEVTLSFVPDANFEGTPSFTFAAIDNNGLEDATPATANITINAVNDASVTNDATATGDEDAASIAITLSASDIDGTVASFRILTLPDDGTLFSDAGLTNAVSANDLVAASSNEAGLFFVPNENFQGTPTFTFAAVDNEGLQDATPATATITVNAVNDDPEVSNPLSETASEDSAVFTVDLLQGASDVDNLPGELSVAGLSGLVDGITFNATDNTLRIDPSDASFQSLGTGETENITISYDIVDGTGGSVSQTATINITGTNDTPSIDLDVDNSSGSLGADYNATFTEGFGGVSIVDTDLLIQDLDDTNIVSATITLTNASDDEAESITNSVTSPPNIETSIFNSETGVLALSGSASIADYITVIESIVYDNTSDAPTGGNRVITITLSDGEGNSNTATSTITVVPQNDPPVADDQSITLDEDGSFAGTLTSTDPDGNDTAVYSLASGPASAPQNGDVVINADGTFTYTPGANFSGTDNFTFLVTDGSDAIDTGNVQITVNAVNDAPETNSATATGDEDAASIAITLSGSDVDGTVASFRILTLPNDGTLFSDAGLANAVSVNDLVAASNNEAGLFFVPNENFVGTPSFTFAAVDNEGLQDATPATATITVNAVNDAPETNEATATGNEDATSITLTLSGSDVDGTVASFRIATLPANGTLFSDASLMNPVLADDLIAAIGNSVDLFFAPNGNFEGTETFTFAAIDNDGLEDSTLATATITVNAVNDAPVTNDATATGNEDDASIAITLSGSDVDGTVASFEITALASNGNLFADAALSTLILLNDTVPATGNQATVFFVPLANFNGTDTFEFTAIDDQGLADATPATASLTVNSVNDAPFASPSSQSGDEDATSIEVALSGNDIDGTVTSFRISELPGNGTFFSDAALSNPVLVGDTITATNEAASLFFVPNADFNSGTPLFVRFFATDNEGFESEGTANAAITVNAVNDAPETNDATASGNEDATSITITLSGSDVDGTVDAFRIINVPDIGTLFSDAGLMNTVSAGDLVSATGNEVDLFFVPGENFQGTAGFDFAGVDDAGLQDPTPARATITVNSVNDAPTTNSATATGNEDDASIAVTLTGADVDGTVANFRILSLSPNGTLFSDTALTNEISVNDLVSANDNSAIVFFVPNENFSGTPTFAFAAVDNNGVEDATPATATITVNAVNDAPQTNDVTVSGDEDAASIEILLNGDDADNAIEEFRIESLPENGILYSDEALTIVLMANDVVEADSNSANVFFVPNADFNGTVSFDFVAIDAGGLASPTPATASITVNAVNDAPDIVLSSGAQLGANIVQNGGFENTPNGAGSGGVVTVQNGDSTTIPGFTVTSGNVDIVSSLSSLNPVEGDRFIDLNGDTPGAITTNLSTVVGETYQVSFLLSGDPLDGEIPESGLGNETTDITVSVNGVPQTFSFQNPSGATRANPGSIEHTLTFTADTTLTSFTFASADTADPSSGPYVDDIQVRQINAEVFEDTPTALPQVTIVDVDGPLARLTISVDNGTLNFASNASATELDSILAQSSGINVGAGTGTLQFVGTLAEVNTILNGFIEYTPDTNFSGVEVVDIFVNDTNIGAPLTDQQNLLLNVRPVNDAPVLDLDADDSSGATGADYFATFTEGGGPVNIGDFAQSDLSIFDVDSTTIQSATITLTNILDGSDEFLVVDTGAIVNQSLVVTGSGTGTVTITGSGTLSEYEQALENVRYNNLSTSPDTTNRIINVTVNDGVDDSNVAVATIDVVEVNVPPEVGNVGQRVTPDTTDAGDQLGSSVAIAADGTVLAGAPFGDGNDGEVIVASPNAFGGFDTVADDGFVNSGSGNFFANDISVNNSGQVVIGRQGHDTFFNTGTPTTNLGIVEVFNINASGGLDFVRTLQPLGDANDFFGISVDINNNGIVAVGANGDDGANNTLTGSGAVYIYNGTGAELAVLRAPDALAGDNFGGAVAINDQGIVVVGATQGQADTGNVVNSGTAYVFTPTLDGGGNITGYNVGVELPFPGSGNSQASNGDNIGSAVAINNLGQIAIGIPSDEFGEGNNSGVVVIFDSPTDTNPQYLLVNESSLAGSSLALNDNGLLAVGAPGSGAGADNARSVYIYQDNGSGTFVLQQVVSEPDGIDASNFGTSVALNNDGTLVVGASLEDNENGADAGAFYTFAPDENGDYTLLTSNLPATEGDTFADNIVATTGNIEAEASAGSQDEHKIVALDNGNFVIVWEGAGAGDAEGIFARIFDADGQEVVGEFRVNPNAAGEQDDPSIAATNGGFVVAYQSDTDINFRVFNNDGTEAVSEQTVSGTNDKNRADVTVLENGNIVVTSTNIDVTSMSEDPGGTDSDVNLQVFNSAGVSVNGPLSAHSPTSGRQERSTVISLEDGGFIVAWDNVDTNEVRYQRFDSNGNTVGSEEVPFGSTDVTRSAVAELSDGSLVFVAENAARNQVLVTLVDTDNTPITAQFSLDTTAAGSQRAPSLIALSDGGFFVAYTSEAGMDDIVAGQRFDFRGNPVGDEVQLTATSIPNISTDRSNGSQTIAQLDDGSIVASFNDGDDVFFRVFDLPTVAPDIRTFDLADTFVATDADVEDMPSIDVSSIAVSTNGATDFSNFFSVNGTEIIYDANDFDFLNDGEAVIVTILFNVVSGDDTVQREFTIRVDGESDSFFTSINGTAGSDGDIIGTDNNDVINSLGNTANTAVADRLFGNGGNDILIGGNTGTEQFDGGDGDDTIFTGNSSPGLGDVTIGSLGNDRINFSGNVTGLQTVSYASFNASMIAIIATIDIAANTGTVEKEEFDTSSMLGGFTVIGTDTLVDITKAAEAEGLKIIGTDIDDIFNITGTQTSVISIAGGDGTDIYNLENSDNGFVELDVSGGNVGADINIFSNFIANDGFGNTETLSGPGSFSGVNGTDNADVLTGSANAETLIGNGGADIITGGGGADTLLGGEGNDTIIVPDLDFNSVDGGADIDGLQILGGGQVLDFSVLEAGKITSIETLDLGEGDNAAGGVGTEITIDETAVIDFSETFNPLVDTLIDESQGLLASPLATSDEALVLTGDAGDTVNLTDSGTNAGASWTLAGNDEGFDVYNFANGGNSFASVAVDDEVTVNVVV